ncbi:CTP synthase [Portunus trituberculatus]|uniref:CTP synthase n=1 Tax=Portunus trituberculatus TaxID=210409 RepID=A0A5B7DIS8_PORTR|nr:CTP synthase [Portunus trituberculatus]
MAENGRPLKPSPPYLGLILAASGKLEQYLARGCRMTPTSSPVSSDEELPMPPQVLTKQTDKYKEVQSLHLATLPNTSSNNDSRTSSDKEGTSKEDQSYMNPMPRLRNPPVGKPCTGQYNCSDNVRPNSGIHLA